MQPPPTAPVRPPRIRMSTTPFATGGTADVIVNVIPVMAAATPSPTAFPHDG